MSIRFNNIAADSEARQAPPDVSCVVAIDRRLSVVRLQPDLR